MAVASLSVGNQQLLQHMRLWASVPTEMTSVDPLTLPNSPSQKSGAEYADALETHLKKVVALEATLLKPLKIPAAELNERFGELPAFGHNLWESSIDWKENPQWASWAIDDVWQLHATRLGMDKKVRLLRSGMTALGGVIPRVAGLALYFNWSQGLLTSRSKLARSVLDRTDGELHQLTLFYDSTERAALNIRRGAEAMNFYKATR